MTSATIEGEAPCEDLAVVRLRPVPDGLSAVTFGDSDSAEIGSRVVAGGYPGGFASEIDEREFQATDGTLSQPSREIELSALEPTIPDALQHQAPIRPGMSGGPTMNEKGEVIGLTMASSADAQDQNLNIAIASEAHPAAAPGSRERQEHRLRRLERARHACRSATAMRSSSAASSPARPRTSARSQGGDVIVKLDDTPGGVAAGDVPHPQLQEQRRLAEGRGRPASASGAAG